MDPLSNLQVNTPATSADTDLVIVILNEFAGARAASLCAASNADHASLAIAA
jgi:hypothetical protein